MTDRRTWSEAEESLLFEVWESNCKNIEFATIKELQVCIHKELCLHLNIPLKDVINKTNRIRRQYRDALLKPQLQYQWKHFQRVHSIMKGVTSLRFRDKQSEQTAQNDNSTDESSVWTIDDSRDEYIGCEPTDINDCQPDIDVYQIEITDPMPEGLEAYLEPRDEVIELDDDDVDENSAATNAQTDDSSNVTLMNEAQATEYEQNITIEHQTAADSNNANTPHTTFVPIQTPQTLIAPTIANNFAPAIENTFPNMETNFEQQIVAQKIYLCQPVQPQPSNNNNIPVAIAIPNCESTAHATQQQTRTQTSRPPPLQALHRAGMQPATNFNDKQTGNHAAESTQAKQRRSRQAPIRPKSRGAAANSNELLRQQLNRSVAIPPQVPTESVADKTAAAMLQTLASIDGSLKNFIQTHENLTRQMYREGLQQTVLLTRILEEEQRRTQLMEHLVKRNN